MGIIRRELLLLNVPVAQKGGEKTRRSHWFLLVKLEMFWEEEKKNKGKKV